MSEPKAKGGKQASGMQFTEEEMRIIIEALRTTEKYSRQGFSKQLAKGIGQVNMDSLKEKMCRAEEALDRIIALRKRFGDTTPVRID